MSEPNPSLKVPSWLIYALLGKVILLVAIAAAVLYFTGALG